MNKDRLEQIDRWAEYVKCNKDWKKLHTEFINAQFQKSEDFYKRLAKTKEGKKKIIELFNIKNKKWHPNWVK